MVPKKDPRPHHRENSVKGKIVKIIKETQKGMTRKELSEKLGYPIATICGRVNELIKENYLIEIDTKEPKEVMAIDV